MKVYFGFNGIKPDGMGSAAINLLSALEKQGISFQTVHPWKEIDVQEFMKFSPVFLTEEKQSPDIKTIIRKMVEVINGDPYCKIFSHFGSPNWGCIVPYLRPDIKVVVSVHSVTPSALKIALANKERTSVFVPVSWAVEKKLKQVLPSSWHHKIMRVSNAVDVSQYTQKTEYHRDIPKILFAGRVEDVTKGCDKIPKIARSLKDKGFRFEWDLYGYFHWGYEKKFYPQLKKYSVEECVKYKGCLDQSELRNILPQYDVTVVPSNHEGFGLSLLDAMASKVPCVASNLSGSTSKIIQDQQSGFLVGRNDIDGFANAIGRLLDDPELCETIGINGYQRVLDHFDLEPHGKGYQAVFEQALCDQTVYHQQKFDQTTFHQPEALKPHLLARVLPLWLKKILKRIV